jgi:hypothetical protein
VQHQGPGHHEGNDDRAGSDQQYLSGSQCPTAHKAGILPIQGFSGPNTKRSLVGTVQIPSPGTYTITAGPELENAVEPTILVG